MAATITLQPSSSAPWPPRRAAPTAYIGRSGEDALLAGVVVFALSTFVFAVLGSRVHAQHRVFHFLTVAITAIATLSYYAMATNSGVSYIPVDWHSIQGVKVPVFRHVFWVRYVDWALTTPLIVLELALLAGLPWIDSVSLLVVSEGMALTAVFAGLRHDRSASTWGWCVIGFVFMLYIVFQLLWKGRKSVKHQHADVSSLYTILSIYTIVIWILYAVFFALSQGVGVINPKGETIAFTVLDIFGKAVFGISLLAVHKHESEDAAACLPESWTRPRAAKKGLIHLHNGD